MAALERRTLAEQAYRELRRGILNDEYRPGTELREESLARNFGVSRGPIREALQRLASEGLVEIEARRGAVVRSLTRKDFLDAYLVREELEALAVRLAGPHLSDADIAELEESLNLMEAAVANNDDGTFLRENQRFHGLLVERSDNSFLQATHRYVADSMVRYRIRSVIIRGGLEGVVAEHQQIFEALKSGDTAKAVELTRAHIRVPVERLGRLSDDELTELQGDDNLLHPQSDTNAE